MTPSHPASGSVNVGLWSGDRQLESCPKQEFIPLGASWLFLCSPKLQRQPKHEGPEDLLQSPAALPQPRCSSPASHIIPQMVAALMPQVIVTSPRPGPTLAQ
ncbi:hypothetical protein WJX84_010955 [Apatococcus fuscideae]|uniref:Uncharacterized protein n=1 Tax=Apatococcus fuscideae TaxID=2026836 RepID=A0AAW1SYT8_9CHLO